MWVNSKFRNNLYGSVQIHLGEECEYGNLWVRSQSLILICMVPFMLTSVRNVNMWEYGLSYKDSDQYEWVRLC